MPETDRQIQRLDRLEAKCQDLETKIAVLTETVRGLSKALNGQSSIIRALGMTVVTVVIGGIVTVFFAPGGLPTP